MKNKQVRNELFKEEVPRTASPRSSGVQASIKNKQDVPRTASPQSRGGQPTMKNQVCTKLFNIEIGGTASPGKQSILKENVLAQQKRSFDLIDEPIDSLLEQPLTETRQLKDVEIHEVDERVPHSFSTFQKIMGDLFHKGSSIELGSSGRKEAIIPPLTNIEGVRFLSFKG